MELRSVTTAQEQLKDDVKELRDLIGREPTLTKPDGGGGLYGLVAEMKKSLDAMQKAQTEAAEAAAVAQKKAAERRAPWQGLAMYLIGGVSLAIILGVGALVGAWVVRHWTWEPSPRGPQVLHSLWTTFGAPRSPAQEQRVGARARAPLPR